MLNLTHTTLPTPVGEITVAGQNDTLYALAFSDGLPSVIAHLERHLGPLVLEPKGEQLQPPLVDYLAGDLRAIDQVRVQLVGTPFQQRVWSALRKIPAGCTWSYRDLATHLGRPAATRAVGAANGQNPISIVVPCHRVIRADGDLCGYGGGVDRKRWLLAHEGALPATHEAALPAARQLALAAF